MVRRCAWGTCNADIRYPERLNGGFFVNFPTPKADLDKCLRWIKACGRPNEQLNIGNIGWNKAVCSRHFVGGNGPTDQYPDPTPADGSNVTPSRPQPKRRKISFLTPGKENEDIRNGDRTQYDSDPGVKSNASCVDSCIQTPESWTYSASATASLEGELRVKEQELSDLRKIIAEKDSMIKFLEQSITKSQPFNVDGVVKREKDLKNLFKYYTGITYVRFVSLLAFLLPSDDDSRAIKYESGRRELKNITHQNALFLTLCRLRHNFGLKDIAMRFSLSVQSTSVVFRTWIDHMYFRLGQIELWPHRDIIITNMPSDFKKDFPNTLIIIDGTELKTQTPCALGLQSQCYSDYKSSTTLKALIGCDPRGSVIFLSELFTGSISDKIICKDSGFYDLLLSLKKAGYINDGDVIMADKGFTIKDDLEKIGLKLNIPPHAASGAQMSISDSALTQKIAKHRVHIERVIAKVKTYKILSHRIPTSLFGQISKIWSVCGILTLFQDVFIKDK